MAKARVLKVVNYRQEDLSVLAELEATLKREGKEFSEWAREQTAEYVKAHGNGNPNYALEDFGVKDFKAFPTAWEPFGESWNGYSDEEKLDMAKRLRARAQEIKKEIRKLDWYFEWNL